jgi:hypothetical protein
MSASTCQLFTIEKAMPHTQLMTDAEREERLRPLDPPVDDDGEVRVRVRMTNYEYARIKGLRMQQLANGDPPYVEVPQVAGAKLDDIFHAEMRARRMPLIVVRSYNSRKAPALIRVADMDYAGWLPLAPSGGGDPGPNRAAAAPTHGTTRGRNDDACA